MTTRKLTVVFFLLVFALSSAQSDVASYYNEGNKAYRDGKFDEALENYLKAVELGGCDSKLFFNIGNAYFRLGKIGKAILWYERARLLSPNDPDILKNLNFARSLTKDKIVSIYRGSLLQVLFDFIRRIPFKGYWFVLLILSVLATSATIYYILRLSGRWVAVVLWIFVIIFAFGWYVKSASPWELKTAIVVVPKVDVRSEPTETGELLFTIHDGTKVAVKEERFGWYRIMLEDGHSGWVPDSVVELVVAKDLAQRVKKELGEK